MHVFDESALFFRRGESVFADILHEGISKGNEGYEKNQFSQRECQKGCV